MFLTFPAFIETDMVSNVLPGVSSDSVYFSAKERHPLSFSNDLKQALA